MNHQHRFYNLISPALLILMQLCMSGCAGLSQPPYGHPESSSDPVDQTLISTPSTIAEAEANNTYGHPRTADTVAQLESGDLSVGVQFLPKTQPYPPRPEGDKTYESRQNTSLLSSSPKSRLPHAELLRDLGATAKRQGLQEHLLGSLDNPALLEFVISWYLAREDYDAAGYWVKRAQKAGQPVSHWQRLALAVHEADHAAVERLQRESEGELPASTLVDALRRLDRNDTALALAQKSLESMPPSLEAEKLASEVDALALPHSHFGGLYSAKNKLGTLQIFNATARLDLDSPYARFAFNVTQNKLESTNDDALSVKGFDRELDASLRATRIQPTAQFELELGGNQRDDDSILYGQFTWDQRFTQYLLGRIKFGIHEITNTTSTLRAIGTKHFLSVGSTANLTDWEFVRTKLELHRYQTRGNDWLGKGYGAELALGHIFLQELPRWHIELRGSWEKNQLRADVPPELVPSVLSPLTEIDTIIPPDYRSLGIGSTLQYGSSDSGPKRNMQVVLDTWGGWLWPADEPSYNVHLSVGTSIFSRDMLSLDTFYANALNGVSNQAYQGIGVSYRYHF
jgi:hypothetical protein